MRSRRLLATLLAGLVFSSGLTACSRNIVLRPSDADIRQVAPGTVVDGFEVTETSYLVTEGYLRYIARVRLEEAN